MLHVSIFLGFILVIFVDGKVINLSMIHGINLLGVPIVGHPSGIVY